MTWKKLGEVGVDAGMLMICDPCYAIADGRTKSSIAEVYKNWSKFLDKQDYGNVHQMNYSHGNAGLGVVAGTANGDGSYPVYGLFNESGCVAMIVLTDSVTHLPKLPEGAFEQDEE